MTGLAEAVREAVRNVHGGVNYDYDDFCRDVARAVIPVVREHCAEVAEAEAIENAFEDADRNYNLACRDIAAAIRNEK